ncbi:MAG: undecaprenyl-diphosphate phosphatase [Ruminococcaceae bacterium]|nr:undecaprenyl-diphosphate phosphatase [Oscillospiraceae bacterium]
MFIEILKSILFGIVEGITEWLPVSSTGHLILLGEFLELDVSKDVTFAREFKNMFDVVIQLGAILAVAVIYFQKLNPFSGKKNSLEKKNTWSLWGKVVLASIPAALVGIVGDKILEKITGKDIDGWIFNWQVVAAALIIYGILFIIVEKFHTKQTTTNSTDDITVGQAMAIGCFQTLSIVPGTSRSGSTILGARMIGVSRPAAAEFSFFLGIPAICGAALIKGAGFVKYVMESDASVPLTAIVALVVATLVSFIVSMIVVRFLVDFVKKHSFIPFGVYRIALGVLVIAYFAIKG